MKIKKPLSSRGLALWAVALAGAYYLTAPTLVAPAPAAVAEPAPVVELLPEKSAYEGLPRPERVLPSSPYWDVAVSPDDVRNTLNSLQCIGSAKPLNVDASSGLRLCLRQRYGKSAVLLYGGQSIALDEYGNGKMYVRFKFKGGASKMVTYSTNPAKGEYTISMLATTSDMDAFAELLVASKELFVQVPLADGRVQTLYFIVPEKGHGALREWHE